MIWLIVLSSIKAFVCLPWELMTVLTFFKLTHSTNRRTQRVNSKKRLNTLLFQSPVTLQLWCNGSKSDQQSVNVGLSPSKLTSFSEEDVGMVRRSKGHVPVPSGGCYWNCVQHSIDKATSIEN